MYDLCRLMEHRRFHRDGVVFREGEAGTEFYVIMSGKETVVVLDVVVFVVVFDVVVVVVSPRVVSLN